MGFLKQTVKGVSWMGALQVFSRIAGFGKTIVLARILSPADFGLFGIVVLAIAFLETFTETGINAVLIQLKDKIEDFVDTAWIISIIRGTLIAGLIIVFTRFLAHFFASPAVFPLLLLASLIPFIRGFINPAIIVLQKELQFQKEFFLRSAILLTDVAFSILLVILTRSVIGLLWGVIIGAMIEVLLSFVFLSPRPRLAFEKEKFVKIIGFGKWVTLNGIFAYLADRIDDIFVGRVLGVASLGIYQMAYKISSLSFTEISNMTSKVTFPVYSKITTDPQRLKRAYLRTLLVISISSLFISSLLFLFPHQLIRLTLGVRWLAAAEPLRILALFGLTKAIGSSAAPLFLSMGKPHLMAKITGLKFLVLAVLLIPLTLKFNLIGTSMAVLFSSLAIQPIIWINVIRIFK
jgi:O-antigen/teichoic acid export membrane protein